MLQILPNKSAAHQQELKQKLIKIHKEAKEDNADNLVNPNLPAQDLKSLAEMHELRQS
jgi:hypothetical protein